MYLQKSSITLNYKAIEPMLNVFQAIRNSNNINTIKELLKKILSTSEYQICEEQYRIEKKQITLDEFKNFILSFSSNSKETQDNKRLLFLKKYYIDAINNLEKYKNALNKIKFISNDDIKEALNIALYWLPGNINLDVEVLILFDIGGGAWAYKSKSGKYYTAFNILFLLDDQGHFDKDMFLLTLAHELHHLGIPLNTYLKSINYETLSDTHPLKLYSDFFYSIIKEGMAQKFCSNAPTNFSLKPYPEKKFAALKRVEKTWLCFMKEFKDIHKHAIQDLQNIVDGNITDISKFWKDYSNYWTWKAGQIENKDISLGRRYYYGSEILGLINAGMGRTALFEVMFDFRKLLFLYNKSLKKLHPDLYDKYKFPEALVEMIKNL
ncbi:DUF5700 domain-containing putative Zn-dependent protease [Marinitoga lauensis]|uniref:DUF5700 domain-containing putative Zn-dependent protease n=1 Tax=Marinitoga lauensis TaxID=2201189 RepID=UPI001011D6D8|nr:DUF5700 domain-containing putative Zn-dependent protease [Marinitoga lauensis]